MANVLFRLTDWAYRLSVIGAVASFIVALIYIRQLQQFPLWVQLLVLLTPVVILLHQNTRIFLRRPSNTFEHPNSGPPSVLPQQSLASGSKWKYWKFLLASLEWLLLAAEAIACSFLFYVGMCEAPPILITAFLLQTMGAFSLIILRTADIFITRGGRLFGAFRPLRKNQSHMSLAWGRLWDFGLSGEHFWIKTIRVFLTAMILFALTSFSIYALIIEPSQEAGLIPLKTSHADQFPFGLNVADPRWRIVLRVWRSPYNDIVPFNNGVNVQLLSTRSTSDAFCQPTGNDEPDSYFRGGQISIDCPNQSGFSEYWMYHLDYQFGFLLPDLFITVNFTALGIAQSTIHIFPGLTNHTNNIVSSTLAIPLIPGLHLHGSLTPEIRTKFVNPSASSLGILASSVSFLVAKVVMLVPDPLTPVPSMNNISTLRLSCNKVVNGWTIVQDYRQQSVLNGFSNVGGLWTFLNGIFAMIFGSSMLLVLFGMKPLTVFGLVHYFHKRQLLDNLRLSVVERGGGLDSTECYTQSSIASIMNFFIDDDLIGSDYGDDTHLAQTSEPARMDGEDIALVEREQRI